MQRCGASTCSPTWIPDAREFIAAYANASVSTSITAGSARRLPSPRDGLSRTWSSRDSRGEAGQATRALLETTAPMDIVDNVLIPALDQVGADFEQNKVFLPQLIQSAGAAQAAFEVIREKLSTGEGAM